MVCTPPLFLFLADLSYGEYGILVNTNIAINEPRDLTDIPRCKGEGRVALLSQLWNSLPFVPLIGHYFHGFLFTTIGHRNFIYEHNTDFSTTHFDDFFQVSRL